MTAMSVEKTTVTLLKHQVLSLAQLVVYVVFEEAVATGNLANANLLLITELSEALMWRLGGSAGTHIAAPGMHELHKPLPTLIYAGALPSMYMPSFTTMPGHLAGSEQDKLHQDSTSLSLLLIRRRQVHSGPFLSCQVTVMTLSCRYQVLMHVIIAGLKRCHCSAT